MALGLAGRDRPIVLMYHRVARIAQDPWELAVRPERFAAQIEALVRERSVVPLRWLAGELAHGRVPKRTAAVTFDDGYADVLLNGKPVLEQFACPATVFLTTGAIGSARGFWWDELSRIVLESAVLPSELRIEIGGRLYRWRLQGGAGEAPSAEDRQMPALSRAKLHRTLWELLRPLDPMPRQRHLDGLFAWAGIDRQGGSRDRALAADEVRRLSEPGFIDIGAHTVTHPSMPLLNEPARRAEVDESRRACEELVDAPVDGFAYPFGDLDDASVATVREAGFSFACSTSPRRVSSHSNLLRLPRIGVGDWSGETLMRRLSEVVRR